MLKFIVRRIFWTIPVLLVVIFLTFIMMRQIGGNPFRHSERAVPEAVQRNLERKFHVNDPWCKQYAYYVKGVFTLDFGPSLVLRGQTVNDIIKEHFPKSVELGFYAFLFAIFFGVPLGMIAALRHNTGDRLRGDVLLEHLSRHPELPRRDAADLLPRAQVAASRADERLVDVAAQDAARRSRSASPRWRSSPGSCAGRCSRRCSRTTSARPARRGCATGGSSGSTSCATRSSPSITAAGPLLGFIITGSFVIELIFNIPGIGQYYVTAVNARDYSVVMGLTVLLSVLVIMANLIVDILYGILDPRTRDART